jgi:serine/threonine protein kinase
MEKYGPSLQVMLKNSKYGRFTIKTAVQIGAQIIDRLQGLHEQGYIHNDLKPDNLLLRSNARNKLSSSEVILIDFGVSRNYVDNIGEHLEQAQTNILTGNLIYSSHNAFKYETLSRRDDLISLAYLLVFFFNSKLDWVSKIN